MPAPAAHHPSAAAPRSLFLRLHRWLALPLLALATVSVYALVPTTGHKISSTFAPSPPQMDVTGSVVVTTTVDASGKVVKAETDSDNKLLAPAAIEAVKKWKFAPGDSTTTFPVTINFKSH